MKKTAYILFIALVSLMGIQGTPSGTAGSAPENLPAGVISAMKSGNASELASFFNSSIELNLMGKESIYSKSQSIVIMKDFFSKYPPTGFVIKFEGGKENSQYAIGNLTTTQGNFRVNFLIKNQLIHQLRIDKE